MLIRSFILGCLFVICALQIQAQESAVVRCEPPFWWAGMHHPEVQILLYGTGLGDLNPQLDYPGVSIARSVRVDNSAYLFVYLTIAPDAAPEMLQIKLMKNQQAAINIPFELRPRRPESVNRQGFGAEDVICLITPDRFANGDPDNDEFSHLPDRLDRRSPMGRHGGDIQGIIDHLDYLDGMGYTALWINPLTENNMPRASYHGYATTDYYRIDPRFGTMEDYLKLSAMMQKRGMKLIMDQVMNHCGSEHWWMKDMPTHDWVNYPASYTQTNHMRSTLHDPYAAAADREVFTDGWFVKTMPDMNQNNPLLADYLIQNSIWWIEYAGLQGVRHDTHPYAGEDFMNSYTCRIMNEYPGYNIVGEEWSLNPLVIAKWQRGQHVLPGFSSCLPSLMDFPLQHALTKALSEPEGWNSGWIVLYEALGNDIAYADPNNLVVFGDNHDIDRLFRLLGSDVAKFRMALAFLLTTRGIPQIYYGTELMLTNERGGDHGLIREDFPGGWPGDRSNAFTGEGLSEDVAAMQAYTRQLMIWRKHEPLIHHGRLMHFAPFEGVYTYFRYDHERAIMVTLNKNNFPQRVDPGRFKEIIGAQHSATDVLTRETINLNDLVLTPMSATILELKLK